MANLGQLVVNLEANIAKFTSDMGRASQTVEQTMSRMNAAADVVKGVLGAVGVAFSVDVLVGEVNKAIDALADLDDMAQKSGSSVEMLSRLGKVANMTGVEFGGVDGAIVKLSKNLAGIDDEGNKTAKALAAIGISTDDIKNKDPAQVFVEVANKLQAYEDGANKVALVTDLMGKSAADLLPYMNDVAENLDKFEGDSAEAAAKASQLQDGLGELRVKYGELRAEIVVAALPAANAFIGALIDTKREANALTAGTNVDTWADGVAIVLARIVDRAKLVAGALGVVSGSVKSVAADIEVAATLTPAVMAYELSQGRNPLDNFRATMAERDKIVMDANAKLAAFIDAPFDLTERATIKRIAEQKDAAGLAALGGLVGVNGISSGKTLDYSGGDEKTTKTAKDAKKKAEIVDPIPAVARMRESAPNETMADRLVRSALNETLAIQGTIDATEALQAADQKRMEQQLRATERNAANVERIRQDLMTDVEHEQSVYESRLDQLRIFQDSKLENEILGNELIRQETERHNAAILEMQRQTAEQRMMLDLQTVQMASNSANQLYAVLEQAGMEQTALGKAMFVANKALAIAEIVMNTELGAAKALAMGPVIGPPLAMMIRGLGYASAGVVLGTTIASAEGGYDIPAGTNPVTQLHEKEMVLPKAQAEVIRGLAMRGGAGGGGLTIHYEPNFNVDSRTDRAAAMKDMQTVAQQANADLVDRLQRAGRI